MEILDLEICYKIVKMLSDWKMLLSEIIWKMKDDVIKELDRIIEENIGTGDMYEMWNYKWRIVNQILKKYII